MKELRDFIYRMVTLFLLLMLAYQHDKNEKLQEQLDGQLKCIVAIKDYIVAEHQPDVKIQVEPSLKQTAYRHDNTTLTDNYQPRVPK